MLYLKMLSIPFDGNLFKKGGDGRITHCCCVSTNWKFFSTVFQGFFITTLKAAIWDFPCDEFWWQRLCYVSIQVFDMHAYMYVFDDDYDNDCDFSSSSEVDLWEVHKFCVRIFMWLSCDIMLSLKAFVIYCRQMTEEFIKQSWFI